MKYYFHPDAENEFLEAIDYYEKRSEGLGLDFSMEVFHTINRILAYPKAWPKLDTNIHRSLVTRFPYGILYNIDRNRIFILAVMHLNRKPGYWKQRECE